MKKKGGGGMVSSNQKGCRGFCTHLIPQEYEIKTFSLLVRCQSGIIYNVMVFFSNL